MVYSQAINLSSNVNFSDPDRPDYRPSWWSDAVCHWQETLDWTGNLKNLDFKEKYLNIVPGELKEDRQARVAATSPLPYFKEAVGDHASIFTQFELSEGAPPSLVELEDSVDGTGTDIWQFAEETFKAFFRDGAVLLGVDMPPASTEDDLRNPDRRPVMKWVPMRDVFWPEYRIINGVSVLARVSIRRSKQIKASQSGELLSRYDYWVYELNEQGQCQLTIHYEDENQKLSEGESRLILGADGMPLKRIPFADKLSCIGNINMDAENQIESIFADVLHLGQEHYNARSEYDTVCKKSALPTPYRKWEGGVPPSPPPFYVGPSKCIHLGEKDEVGFLELGGQSLPELKDRVIRLEMEIQQRNNKLFHVGDAAARSATEAAIENQKSKVSLPGIATRIESAYQDLFEIWELFANPSPDETGGIEVQTSVLDAPPDPAAMAATLQGVALGIPIEAAIAKLIRDGHYHPEDFSAQAMPGVLTTLPTDPNEVIQ